MYIYIVYIVEGIGQKLVAWITSLLRVCAGTQNKKEIIAVVNALNASDQGLLKYNSSAQNI
jgi:hypothetical protein